MHKTLLSTLAGLAVAGTLAAPAIAGDCRRVQFEITNNTGEQVKLRKVDIEGNDRRWNEDFNNKKLDHGFKYNTNNRRLNGLDSGNRGKFHLKYDKRKPETNEWITKNWNFLNENPCFDGKIYHWTIF